MIMNDHLQLKTFLYQSFFWCWAMIIIRQVNFLFKVSLFDNFPNLTIQKIMLLKYMRKSFISRNHNFFFFHLLHLNILTNALILLNWFLHHHFEKMK
jgi:hypothetical protein